MTLLTLFTIFHLFGVALGAGAAFIGDWIFLNAIKDHRLTKDEHAILRATGSAVWVGLGLLYASGLGIFLTNPEKYLDSEKFLLKMAIIVVITVNGLVLHKRHMPILVGFIDKIKMEAHEVRKHAPQLVLSGSVSIVSWSTALILGVLDSLPIPLPAVIGLYIIAIFIGWFVGLTMSKIFFAKK